MLIRSGGLLMIWLRVQATLHYLAEQGLRQAPRRKGGSGANVAAFQTVTSQAFAGCIFLVSGRLHLRLHLHPIVNLSHTDRAGLSIHQVPCSRSDSHGLQLRHRSGQCRTRSAQY